MLGSRSLVNNVFLVAGCAIGAGCLALPMLAAGPNFIYSFFTLIFVSIFSYYIAKTSLEIYLVYKNDINTSTVAKKSFGQVGVILSGILNIVLMYALLSVYMSGGADLLSKTIFPIIGLKTSNNLALILFLIISVIIFFKGTEIIVKSNTVIFYIKLFSFILALLLGIKFTSPNLFIFTSNEVIYLPKALPVFFGALWFHFLIPVIARINNYDRNRCNKIFKIGLILPVLLYIFWIGIMLSLIPRVGILHSFYNLLHDKQSVGNMILYATHNNPNLPILMKLSINCFSNVALLTSFLTVGISTYDYIRDALKIKQTKYGIILNVIVTLIPPTLFTIFFPNGFLWILEQAIIILMLINILVLTCCLKEYRFLDRKPSKILIWFIIFFLLILILIQLLDNFSLLPSFGN